MKQGMNSLFADAKPAAMCYALHVEFDKKKEMSREQVSTMNKLVIYLVMASSSPQKAPRAVLMSAGEREA